MLHTLSAHLPNDFNRYTGSLHQGNYLWGGAMNLCWAELCQSVIHAPVELETDDTAALEMTACLNHPVCTSADLDAASYYVKAGFGPRTVQTINRECRAHFPHKTFGDLNADLREEDLISYAYFYKKVAYEVPFTRQDMLFKGERVLGFEAVKHQKQTVEVLQYHNDGQFILRLRLQNPADELLLAKGYDNRRPAELLQAIAGLPAQEVPRLGDDDFFKMPLLRLQCRREYTEMLGKALKNKGFAQYIISQMFENIAFELDETGARVENEAAIGALRAAKPHLNTRRNFYLDQPFWVVMKRADSSHPYFLLGVNNTNIMQKRSL